MARLLYGGRNSLLIGVASALICCLLATHRRGSSPASSAGSSTASCRALLDVIWAFPVYLLAISISIVRAHAAGSTSASITLGAGSLWLPIGIIGDHLRPVRRAARSAARCCRVRAEGVRGRRDRAWARPTGA